MATVATLTIDLIGNSAKLNKELRRATKNTDDWAKKTRAAINSAGKVFAGMGAAAAVGLAAIYTEAAKAADQLAKLSDEIGEAPERITALQHVAELTGASTEKFNTSIERMTKRLGEAMQGTGTAAKTIEQLGLSTQEFFRASPADQFAMIADQVNALGTQQEKAAAAAAIFGRDGLALVNTLALGSDGLAAMEAEANQLGITLDRVQLAKIEAANDSFFRARQVAGGFGRSLAAAVAPAVDALSQAFVGAAKEAGGFQNIALNMVDVVATGVGIMANGVHGLRILFKALAAGVATAIDVQVQRIAMLDRAVASLANQIPGVQAQANEFIQRAAETSAQVAKDLRNELNELALTKIPSQKIKEWLEDARNKSQVAAEQVAADRAISLPVAIDLTNTLGGQQNSRAANDAQAAEDRAARDQQRAAAAARAEVQRIEQENQRIIAAQKSKFEQIHEAALQADGKLVQLEEFRRARQAAELQADLERLRERGLLTEEIEQQFRTAREQQEQVHQQRIAQIQAQNAAVQLNNYSTLFDSMAGVAEAFKGKQSGVYRALFAASKGFAVAESIVKIQQGLASALSLPFPQSLPAYATVFQQAAGIIPTIQGTELVGQAHDGIDQVKQTGSYYLQKGERVSTADTSAKLDGTLDKLMGLMSGGGLNGRASLQLGLDRGLLIEDLREDDDFARLVNNIVQRAS